MHMLAACTGRDVPVRASNEFVQRTFDSFASSFESKLKRLSYRAPALIAAMVGDLALEASKSLDVLDAGCGTGLCGPLIAPYARRLVGIDLSEGMLTHAKDKNIYHALVKAELTKYLRDKREAFDLIVSADTLVYFGDLEGVLVAATRALRPNGFMVFTLEHAVSGSPDVDYRLGFHGRYSHGRAYVEQILTVVGLQPKIAQAELRTEAGVPVAGLVVRATKSVATCFDPVYTAAQDLEQCAYVLTFIKSSRTDSKSIVRAGRVYANNAASRAGIVSSANSRSHLACRPGCLTGCGERLAGPFC